MGVGGISIWQLLIILVIVLLLFGTKRLKNIGSDLGGAIRGFRSSMANSDNDDAETSASDSTPDKSDSHAEAQQRTSASASPPKDSPRASGPKAPD